MGFQLTFTDSEFKAFATWLSSVSGITVPDSKHYLVRSRLSPLVNREQFESLTELLDVVKKPGSRLKDEVIDLMTTNETLWFRDKHPFDILNRVILPEMAQTKSLSKIKIWSAACSTGQELYSIHMTVKEYAEQLNRFPGVQLIGTDISETAVAAARKGVFKDIDIRRGLDSSMVSKWFTQSDGQYEVNRSLKIGTEFRKMNFMDARWSVGEFDIIFVRNVLIYFTQEEKEKILRRMHQHLNKGGYLFLGATESMPGLKDLYETVNCRPGIVYKKI